MRSVRSVVQSLRRGSSEATQEERDSAAGATRVAAAVERLDAPPVHPAGRLHRSNASRRLQASGFAPPLQHAESPSVSAPASEAAENLTNAESQALNNTLSQWVLGSPSEEFPSRCAAISRIQQAHRTNAAELDLSRLQLTQLPDCLDMLSSTVVLNVSQNRLTSLPAMPPSLLALDVRANQLVSAHTIPANLRALSTNVEQNQMPDVLQGHWAAIVQWNLAHVDSSPEGLKKATYSEEIETIVERFRSWEPESFEVDAGVQSKWIAIAHETHAPVFAEFLENLFNTGEFKDHRTGPAMEKKVIGLVQELFDSPKFRATCFAIAQEASETCDDRVTLALNDMSLALINHHAEQGRYSEPDLMTMGCGLFRLHVLDGLAAGKVKEQEKAYRRHPVAENKVDPIEVRLAYHTLLAERLSLPGVAHAMKYSYDAKITDADLDIAEKSVRDLEKVGAHVKHLATWSPWVKALERRYPQAVALSEERIELDREWLTFQPAGMSAPQYITADKDRQADEAFLRAREMVRLTWQYLSEEAVKAGEPTPSS